MADATWNVELDWTDSPVTTESVLIDVGASRDRREGIPDARQARAATLVPSSPIDALMKLV